MTNKINRYFSFLLYIPILFLSLTIIAGCSDDPDDDNNPDGTPIATFKDIDVVTGMNLFDDNGAPIGQWRTPNHNPGDARIFPIPAVGVVGLDSDQNLLQVWLVPADCISANETDILDETPNLSYTLSEIDDAQIRKIEITDNYSIINLDFSDVEIGFYKLFYETDSNDIFWQNMYIDPSVNNISDLSVLDDACN